MGVTAVPHSPRRDAVRNHARLLAAARELFISDGFDVPAAAIARRAQVGTATLYRHFPARSDLVDAVFGAEVRHCLALLEEAVSADVPWDGLARTLEAVAELESAAPGFAGSMFAQNRGTPLMARFQSAVLAHLSTLAERLRKEADARPDLRGSDLLMAVTAVRAVAMSERRNAVRNARRFADVITEGMRRQASDADPEFRAGQGALTSMSGARRTIRRTR